MKRTSQWAAIAVVAVSFAAVAATTPYTTMSGKWTGSITTNMKDTTGGGNPTAGETGTPVKFDFAMKGTDMTGTSMVGTSSEAWQFTGDTYTWNDSEMTVTATKVMYKDIPMWMKTESGLKETDTYFVYKFASCMMNKTKKACVPGTDIPDGMEKSGMWMFKVEKDTMMSGVLYTYSNGGKRVLMQKLARSK